MLGTRPYVFAGECFIGTEYQFILNQDAVELFLIVTSVKLAGLMHSVDVFCPFGPANYVIGPSTTYVSYHIRPDNDTSPTLSVT